MPESNSPQGNSGNVAVLAACCACPGCRIGQPCEWAERRCAHRRDRSCDSRCNDSAAHPWYRKVDGVLEVAHSWCLPQRYTVEGWKRGRDEVTPDDLDPERCCVRCGGSMQRWPR